MRRVSLQEEKDEDVSEEEEREGRVTSVAACPPHKQGNGENIIDEENKRR